MTEASGILGGLGSILSGLLGEGSIAQQFLVWGELSAVVAALNGPLLQSLTNDLNAKNPVVPISPADAADMVIRGIIDQVAGAAQAAKAGVSGDDFTLLVNNTGEPPALELMLQLMRRGEATQADVTRAIKQSRVRDEWVPFLMHAGEMPPTPADILRAALQGQVDIETAKQYYQELGGMPQWFQLMFDAEGSAPTPVEAATMANRGAIPWEGEGPDVISFHQAFLEGPWRDKWEAPFRKLAEYYPPVRTIVTLVHAGVITDAQATEYMAQQGMQPDLITAYLTEAHQAKAATAHTLATSTILELYADKAITAQAATEMLVKNHYSADDAALELQLTDVKREKRYLDLAISKVQSLYIAHKASKVDAQSALRTLGVPQEQLDHLFTIWDLEREANIAHITPAQIATGYKWEIIDEATALSMLAARGYLPHDAWLFLSIALHSAQPNEPPPDVPPGA